MPREHATFAVSKNAYSRIGSSKNSREQSMTPEEQSIVDQQLREVIEQIGSKHQRREVLDWYHRRGKSSQSRW